MDLFSYPPGSFDYGRLSPHLENHSMEISDFHYSFDDDNFQSHMGQMLATV